VTSIFEDHYTYPVADEYPGSHLSDLRTYSSLVAELDL